MNDFNKYLVWRCFHCGRWQGRQNNACKPNMTGQEIMDAINKISLKCIRCGKTRKLKLKDQEGLTGKLIWLGSPQEATKIIQELTKPKSSS